jgi:predicted alpha/beta hydrolase family esterase
MSYRIVFLHGLESGPHGSKYQTLQDLGLGPVLAPDCEGMADPVARLAKIRKALQDEPYLLLVGSSFGALMALRYAAQWPGQVAGLVLCAPAVHRPEWPAPQPPRGIPVAVLHGAQDDVVPLQAVRKWTRWDASLTVVQDGHRLAASHAELAGLVREVWQQLSPPYQRRQFDGLTPGSAKMPRYRRQYVYERGPDVEQWQGVSERRPRLTGLTLPMLRQNLLLGRCQLRVVRSDAVKGSSEPVLLMFGYDQEDAEGIGTIAVPASQFRGVSGNWTAVAWLDRHLQVEPVREFPPRMLQVMAARSWQWSMQPAVDLAAALMAVVRDPSIAKWPAGWFVSQLGRCARCAKVLTDPVSQRRGVGPECLEILEQLPAVRVLGAVMDGQPDSAAAAAWNSGVDELVRLGLAQRKPRSYRAHLDEMRRERVRREAFEAAQLAEATAMFRAKVAADAKVEAAKRAKKRATAAKRKAAVATTTKKPKAAKLRQQTAAATKAKAPKSREKVTATTQATASKPRQTRASAPKATATKAGKKGAAATQAVQSKTQIAAPATTPAPVTTPASATTPAPATTPATRRPPATTPQRPPQTPRTRQRRTPARS